MTTLKVKDVFELRNALLQLDGTDKEVPVQGQLGQPGQLKVVKKPYKFVGKVRLKIARNLNALNEAAERSEGKRDEINMAHKKVIEEIKCTLQTTPGLDVARVQGAAIADYQKKFGEVMKEEVPVDLQSITEDELNLDANDIPHQALAEVLKWLVDYKPNEL